MGIDKSTFSAFTHCRYKAFLKTIGTVGEPVEYELVRTEADDGFRGEAIERLLRRTKGAIARQPISLASAIAEENELILGARGEGLGMALTFDVIERLADRYETRQPHYVPVLFCRKNSIAKEDSRLAALHGIVLSEAIGQPVPFVKIIHGSGFSVT